MDEETQYMQARNVTLTPEQVSFIKILMLKYHMTFSAALRFILIDYMKQQEKEE